MCGIFGYVGPKKTAATIVHEGLKRLEYRGYDSWGVAVLPRKKKGKKNTIAVTKRAGKIGKATVKSMPEGQVALGHTRWATHGGVTDANAHPHLGCKKSVAIIHNGIIENYESLRKKLKKKGHRFVSDTDSEVAAHLIEDYAETMSFPKAFQKAFNALHGLNAIIALSLKDGTLVAARNGSPLVVGFDDTQNYLASDAAALLPHTKQVHFLDDNEMVIIDQGRVQMYHAETGSRIRPRKQNLTWTIDEAEKGAYDYYMLKEIHEQAGLVTDIATHSASYARNIASILKRASRVYMVGCGTASYACVAGQYLFSQIAKFPISPAIGSEFGYHSDFLDKKSVVLALSQSGETMDTLEAIKQAKDKGATIISMVNVMGSTLYRMSDHKMLIGAGPEKGVASTKAFIGKLAHLTLLAHALNGDVKGGQQILMKTAKATKAVLAKKSVTHIRKLAREIHKRNHIYVIGRGLSYPASLEAALKIKEISYIHAEGFAAGELKHGVIALVEDGTPCIAFVPNDETRNDNISGAMEMKARGGYIIGISDTNHDVFDYHIPVKDAGVATIIPNVVAAQLLAYYLTIERGQDPDMPRNLAKSVTVK